MLLQAARTRSGYGYQARKASDELSPELRKFRELLPVSITAEMFVKASEGYGLASRISQEVEDMPKAEICGVW